MLRYPLCINAQKLVKLIKFSNEWAMQTVPRYRKESLPAASKKKRGEEGGKVQKGSVLGLSSRKWSENISRVHSTFSIL